MSEGASGGKRLGGLEAPLAPRWAAAATAALDAAFERLIADLTTTADATIKNAVVRIEIPAAHFVYERGLGQDTRLDSLWFGASARTNRAAMEAALELAI